MMANSGKTHGLAALKRVVSARGIDGLDARTTAVRAVNEWRAALVNDLGGEQAISTQKAALVDVAARTMLYLNHVDSFLMQQQTLVNKRRRSLYPIVRERQSLADGLARLLGQLGLQRVPKAIPSLHDYLRTKEAEKASTTASPATETASGDAIAGPEERDTQKEQSK
jgi:hypothetical protein